jgi:hypothetical protein
MRGRGSLGYPPKPTPADITSRTFLRVALILCPATSDPQYFILSSIDLLAHWLVVVYEDFI